MGSQLGWRSNGEVGMRLLWSKPPNRQAIGSYPGWRWTNWAGIRLPWSKPPQSTARGFHPDLRWTGRVGIRCFEANIPTAQLWVPTMTGGGRLGLGKTQLWSKPPHSTAMGSHPGWRWIGDTEIWLDYARLFFYWWHFFPPCGSP